MATILDLIEREIVPFDPPTILRYPTTKHEVDRLKCCGDIFIRNFPNERPVSLYSSSLRFHYQKKNLALKINCTCERAIRLRQTVF